MYTPNLGWVGDAVPAEFQDRGPPAVPMHASHPFSTSLDVTRMKNAAKSFTCLPIHPTHSRPTHSRPTPYSLPQASSCPAQSHSSPCFWWPCCLAAPPRLPLPAAKMVSQCSDRRAACIASRLCVDDKVLPCRVGKDCLLISQPAAPT